MEKMITSNKKRLKIGQLTKHLWVCCITLIAALLISAGAMAQDGCQNSTRYPSATKNPNADGSLTGISTCSYFEEYSEIGGIIDGYEYEFSGEKNSNGAMAYITVRSGSVDGPVVNAGFSPLTITASGSDNLFVHWNADSDCSTSTGCSTTTVICNTCANVPDCDGVPGGPAQPGTSCDDGDPATVNDVYGDDCQCAGELPPDNDNCAGAIALSCGQAVNGNTSSATADTTGCGTSSGPGVWYTFTAPYNAIVTLQTCYDGTDFDNVLNVYTGACDDLTCFNGFSDDGYADGATGGLPYCSGSKAGGVFTASAGETYYILLSGYYSYSVGNYELSVDCQELTCEAPSLDLVVVDANGGTIEGCLPSNGEFYLNASLSGGSGNASYYVFANEADTVTVSAGNESPTSFGPYLSGTAVEVGVSGLEDQQCDQIQDALIPVICPPDNITCDQAIPLVCNAPADTVSSLGSQAVAPDGCSIADKGVWFTFPGTGGDINITSDASFDHKMSIFSGSCDALENIGCDDQSTGTETFTIAASEDGTDYFVYIAYWYSSSSNPSVGDIAISIECIEPPLCEAPQLNLIVADIAGNPIECLDPDGEFYVIAILSGGQGNDTFSVSANDGDPVIILNQNSYTFGPFPVGTNVDVDATGADDAQCGAIETANSPPLCAPDNDDCSGAVALACDQPITGTTQGATASGLPTSCAGYSSAGLDVFYSFEADGESSYAVTVGNVESSFSFDGVLFIYSGSCDQLTQVGNCEDSGGAETIELDAPAAGTYYVRTYDWSGTSAFVISLECVAPALCQPPSLDLAIVDANGGDIEGCLPSDGVFYVNATLSGGSGNDSYDVSANGGESVNIPADGSDLLGPFNAGLDLDILATGADDAQCDALESIDSPEVCPPSNDNCADAISFEVGEAGIVGDNTNASADGPDMDCGYGEIDNDVWFSFVAPENGNLTIETSAIDGSSMSDTQIQILDGCGGSSLGCSEDEGDVYFSLITLACGEYVPGQTYLVQVDGYYGDEGQFKLSVVADDAICYDCPQFEANLGDACDDNDANTENDVIVEGCGCAGTPIIVPPTPTCDNFVYFLSDHASADDVSDIYKVTLNGADAILDHIITSDIEVHLAYNPADNLLYAVSRDFHSYRTLDPYAAVPAFSNPVDLGNNLTQITAAVFNADGKLLIGSQNQNKIWSVNVSTNVVSPYDAYAPVQGGDLAFASDGMLYLATRTGAGLYEVWPDPSPDQLIPGPGVPDNVTGMAITDIDQLLISSRDNTNLVVRNTDGSDAGSYDVILNGESFTLRNGDMASGCDTHTNVEDDCNYKLYYVHTPSGGGNQPLLEVTLNNDGTASYNAIIANLGGHIGLSPDGSTIYNVGGSNLKVIDVATASVINTVNIHTAGGQNLSGFPAALVSADGTLYIAGQNQVYTVDPTSGIAIPYGPSRAVNGGDLIEVDAEIWLITRNNNTFTNVLTGASFTVPVNEINGAAVLSNGNVLLADGNDGSLMKEVDLSTQEVVGTYDIGLPLYNGDLAGNCTNTNNLIEGCYGVEVLEFAQGPQTNGSAVPANRSDASQALGEPDRSNAAGGFVSLGVGGSITIAFAGVINDAPGNDIKIWETSFSGDVCGASDDESADIELSANGLNFVSVGSICRDGEVDLADAGLAAVRYIRITNAASTGSLDGYDVDGVEAINGCSNEPVIIPGECYAAEMLEYIEGVRDNGSPISIERTDATNALGMPERTDALNYVSLGYGGSIVLGFNGAVPNGDGDDIEIVETTFNFSSVAAYPEFADVFVSVDGEAWTWAGLVDHEDRFIDISDAGTFAYINYVKIVNSDLSSTEDAFDVDGVVALHNCEEGDDAPATTEALSTLTSYPNPTSGASEVVFTPAQTGTTLVEVYDMNGRNVATLFNQVANSNQQYRLDFNGNNLPNGVYIYRMTTNNETIINKFMIAK